MEIAIREIEEEDYNAVLSLWKELGNKLVTADNIALHYDRVKNDDRYKTFVALLDSKVVGLISSVQSYEVGYEVGFIHIVGLVVRNENQGKGIGTKLLQHFEVYAKDKGVHSIILNTGVQRTGAHAFYKANGYDNHSWCFSKRL